MKAKFSLIVQYFFVLLFVYAAISKLITFDTFQVQLTQSPLLSAYASIIAYLVIIVELVIALLLTLKQTKTVGLYLSYGLMVAFTIYIYLILNYSDFIPCSCGGILEKMGWREHLWFNIIVCILGLLAIYFQENDKVNNKTNKKRFILSSILLTILSIGVVILLFLSSEHIIKKENPFIRRYLPHAVIEDQTLDLQVNSFYFSGYHHDTIYLGNYTAPLRYISIDQQFQRQDFKIQIDSLHLPYSQLKLKTIYPYFYLADGTISIVFKGRLDNQNKQQPTEMLSYKQVYFLDFTPIDSTTIAFKGQSSKNYQNVLGIIDQNTTTKVKLNSNLLQSDSDGVFDTDGVMSYSKENKQLIYTYYYKNQFIQTDQKLNLLNRQNTIDTTKTQSITSAKLSTGENKMTSPIKAINSKVITYRNLLFIVSNSMGQNESQKMWKQASIVDVYDFTSNSYIGSFYINHLGEDKLSDLIVTDHYLYGLFDKNLVRYKLARSLTSKFQ
ncbi:Methylamine utilisation protein MauE [Myroides marinus]|uniref:Methylamine utilisation protein MauE n=1 Tax=Myroides marinus TaxID=703342 RepID=A0A1H6W9S4_9FLAO|nr:MauE/DoxX family redox-associated membrane protein [Myroides marinus]SEJ13718.1 Methylamine utilisation protein MauE [Myroides marinus]